MGYVSDIRCESRPDIVCLEGNGARPSYRGNGYYVGDVMYTLNSTEVHCVCYETLGNYKADGQDGGGVSFAIVGDHENRPTDLTNLVVIDNGTGDDE